MPLTKAERRAGYFKRFTDLLIAAPHIIIVGVDYVGSRQIASIRFELRGKATLLLGKNTMVRSCLRKDLATHPEFNDLLNEVRLNVGLIFCSAPIEEVKKIILANRVPAPAKQGVVAPNDVVVPPGATGLDPSQTSFFQALNIATKIVKGQIEMQSQIDLIKEGERVTASQSVLLQKLNIRPFSYGLIPKRIYNDGCVFDSKLVDTSDEIILEKFAMGLKNVAALSRAICFPTAASMSHCLLEGFKFAAALCIESGDFTFPEMEEMKKFVEDPNAFVAAAPKPTEAKEASKKEVVAAVAEPEEEDESEDDMGFSLFD